MSSQYYRKKGRPPTFRSSWDTKLFTFNSITYPKPPPEPQQEPFLQIPVGLLFADLKPYPNTLRDELETMKSVLTAKENRIQELTEELEKEWMGQKDQ